MNYRHTFHAGNHCDVLKHAALALILDRLAAKLDLRDFVLVDLDIPVFDPFPVFNVADSGICVGVALLAAGLAFERPAPE